MSTGPRQHDPLRQLEYVRQTLSQNKKSIGFFIGAGCPLAIRVNQREENGTLISDPLIRDIEGLTRNVSAKLSSKAGEPKSDWEKVVDMMNVDGNKSPNIEEILTRIRSLYSVAGKGEVRGFKATELEALDKSVCKIIIEEVDRPLPDTKSPYHDLAIWIRSINRENPIHLFTTNYDLLIEQAFEEVFLPLFRWLHRCTNGILRFRGR